MCLRGRLAIQMSGSVAMDRCSSCANRGLGGNKVFKCGRCGHEEDRDANLAKSHLLKALVGVKKY
jgi:transposase